jgi:WD40 repeat protein
MCQSAWRRGNMVVASREGFTVRVLRSGARVSAGVGVVVGDRYVVTCAHVVNAALGRDKREQARPGADTRVDIDFPLLQNADGRLPRRCRLVAWAPPPSAGISGEDIAGLELVEESLLPAGAGPARLLEPTTFWDDSVAVFGYPSDLGQLRPDGAWAWPRLTGVVGGGRIQLDAAREAAFRAQPGYSGSPVVIRDEVGDAVLGIFVAASTDQKFLDSYAIPVAVLAEAWPSVIGRRFASMRWSLQHSPDFRTHWLPRARGVEPDAGNSGWYFVGRRRALKELAEWLGAPARDANDRRTRLVTGSPGSGKSALIAHLLVLADRELRDQVPDLYKRDLPQDLIGSVSVAVHARDKDTGAVIQEIAAAAGVPASTPIELVIALSGRGEPFTIVVDALDEAVPDHIPHIARMLNRLARDPDGVGIRVLVAVRSALEGSPLDSATRELGSRPVIVAVDREPYLVPAEVATYVRRRLLLDGHFEGIPPHAPDAMRGGPGRTPYQDAPELAARVARAVAERSGGNFLVAQLVSRFLAEDPAPVDVSREGWSAQFPGTVDAALAEYIARFGDLERQQWVRDLLTPLAFARGQGLPDNQLWASLASALSRPARTYRPADVHDLMDTAAAYLVDRSALPQRQTYRLYHSAMDQYLRDRCRIKDAAGVVVETLIGCIPVSSDGTRDWRAADPYLRSHLAEHAARAGTSTLQALLADPQFLVYGEPAGLVRVLSRVPVASRGTARVYQVAAHYLDGPPDERASYLTLVARQLGETQLAAGLEKVTEEASWSVTACSWTPPDDYQVILTLDAATTATALASRRPGHVLVVAGDSAGRVQLNRWADGIAEPDDPHDGHADSVTVIAVTGMPDSRLSVLTGCRDGSLRLWHIDDDLLIPVGSLLADAHQDEVTAIAFGSDPAGHEVAVTADRSGGLRLWQVSDDQLVPTWSANSGGRIAALALFRGPSGSPYAISGGGDNADIRLWRPQGPSGSAEYTAIDSPEKSRRIIGAITLYTRRDHAVVFIGTGNGSLYRLFFDADGCRPDAHEFEAQNAGISALQTSGSALWGPDTILAIGSANGDVTLIHDPQGGDITAIELKLYQQVRAHEGKIRNILLTDDFHGEPTVTSCADDRQVVSWTAKREPQPLPGLWEMRSSGITLAATCTEGPYPALCVLQREIPAHAGAGTEIWAFDGSAFTDLTAADTSSKDGWHPVVANITFDGMRTSERPTGMQWLSEEGRNATLLEQSAIAIRYIAGKYAVVTANPMRELRLYDLTLRELKTKVYESSGPAEKHQGQSWIESLAISHDMRKPLLATGGAAGALDLWAIDGHTLVRLSEPEDLSGPGPRLDFVRLRNDELHLLTGDSLGTLGLLTVAGNRLVPACARWHGHRHPITAVASTVNAGGQILAIAGDLSGVVTLWRIDPSEIPVKPMTQIRLGSRVVSLAFRDPWSFVAWCKQGAAVIRWNAELPCGARKCDSGGDLLAWGPEIRFGVSCEQ